MSAGAVFKMIEKVWVLKLVNSEQDWTLDTDDLQSM